jgi:hypothetical protein
VFREEERLGRGSPHFRHHGHFAKKPQNRRGVFSPSSCNNIEFTMIQTMALSRAVSVSLYEADLRPPHGTVPVILAFSILSAIKKKRAFSPPTRIRTDESLGGELCHSLRFQVKLCIETSS